MAAVPLGAPPEADKKKKSQTPIDQQATDAIAAKAALASPTAPAASSAASVVTDVRKDDPVQASADVLKLSGQALTKTATPAANALGVGGNLITSVAKAAQGDTFSAASAAQTAVQQISPALAASPVGAVADAVVLSTGDHKLATQANQLKNTAAKIVDPAATPAQRAKAALDCTCNLQGLANVGRAMGNAIVGLGSFAIQRASNFARLAPMAGKVSASAARVAASPVGRCFGWLNKWIPLLNVAGVALSAKTAVDVFRNPRSSHTTKGLAIASIGTAVGALVAGLTMGGWPFIGVIAASVVADLALAGARKRDLTRGDMDKQALMWWHDPLSGVRDLARLIGRSAPAVGRMVTSPVRKLVQQSSNANARGDIDPNRSFVAIGR